MPATKDAIRWDEGGLDELRRLTGGVARDVKDVVRLFGIWAGRPVTRAAIDSKLLQLGITAHDVVRSHASGGSEVRELRKQLKEAMSELRQLRDQELTDEAVKREILKLADEVVEPPDWLTDTKRASSKGPGVPTVIASDWHWGEVVDPQQVQGINRYNLEIARDRARTFVTHTIDILKRHMVSPDYPGIVFALGGDMVSGTIHDELTITNERPIMPCVVDLVGVLTWAIETFAEEFGNVFLPCVTGNHGRTTIKIPAKQRAHTSFDWLIYAMLQKRFEKDKRIRFQIPAGTDALYQVYGHRYLLTHGDKLGRGGDGIIGALGPILRGDTKRRARNAQIDRGYDTLVIGHWHQLIQLQRVIVNGSLIGYNEYAAQEAFPYEPPRQALWVTHPTHGITFSAPVLVQAKAPKANGLPWVQWTEAA